MTEPETSEFIRHPERFLGLDDESSGRETSAAWVLPLPLDLTTSFLPGTRLGPAAIIEASNQVELYDAAVGCEAAPVYGVHTLPVLVGHLRHHVAPPARPLHVASREQVQDLGPPNGVAGQVAGQGRISPPFAPILPDQPNRSGEVGRMPVVVEVQPGADRGRHKRRDRLRPWHPRPPLPEPLERAARVGA